MCCALPEDSCLYLGIFLSASAGQNQRVNEGPFCTKCCCRSLSAANHAVVRMRQDDYLRRCRGIHGRCPIALESEGTNLQLGSCLETQALRQHALGQRLSKSGRILRFVDLSTEDKSLCSFLPTSACRSRAHQEKKTFKIWCDAEVHRQLADDKFWRPFLQTSARRSRAQRERKTKMLTCIDNSVEDKSLRVFLQTTARRSRA